MKKNPSKILTQSLLYPAVLGSMFVFVIQNISDRGIMYFGIQLNGYWSLILLANFSISYLNNEYLENYSALNLLLDLVEVILIYFAFKELGLLGSPSFESPNYQKFFFILSTIPIIQTIWNLAFGYVSKSLIGLSIMGTLVLISAGFLESKWIYVNIITLCLITIIIAVYLRMLLKE